MTHEEALALIEAEYEGAVDKWGPVYESEIEMLYVLTSEVSEVIKAVYNRDRDGKHGLKIETAQVAAVCIKALEGLKQ